MNTATAATSGGLYPSTLPLDVDDLAAWEPWAATSFIDLTRDNMAWAAKRTVPPFKSITNALTSAGTFKIPTDPEDPTKPHMSAGLAANILLARGVENLNALWHLANTYRRTVYAPEGWDPVDILRRHRAGYTRNLLFVLRRFEMLDFADRWERVFPVRDLTLLIAAGYTPDEWRTALDTGIYPDRAHVEMLAALRAGPR